VLLHEGGSQTPPPGDFNACVGISGPIVAINAALDPAIDVLITGHTHLPYNCLIDDCRRSASHRHERLLLRPRRLGSPARPRQAHQGCAPRPEHIGNHLVDRASAHARSGGHRRDREVDAALFGSRQHPCRVRSPKTSTVALPAKMTGASSRIRQPDRGRPIVGDLANGRRSPS
jgi:hypothetical protein